MDLASLLVLLGINTAAGAYQKGKANANARRLDQAMARIYAWQAKYTDKALEEQYDAEWTELYKSTDGLGHFDENIKRRNACKDRILVEVPEVTGCGNKNWEGRFTMLMLAKQGKIPILFSSDGIYMTTYSYGKGDDKYKRRREENRFMQWYAMYLESHGGPTEMKFFPNDSLVKLSKMEGALRQPMKDYYELDEVDSLLPITGRFDWLENTVRYQTGYWK